MKIVIVGGGKVGLTTAAQIAREGHDITLIDNNRGTVDQLASALDIMITYGNGAALETQREAGVGSSDLLIAATPLDEVNMLCCILARKLGCENTIARIRNQEYAEQLFLLRRELGLSLTINPDLTAAREIFRLLQFPGFLKRDAFVRGRVEIVALALREDSPLCGIKLKDLSKLLKLRILVCAVQRGSEVCIPDGNFELRKGDEIYVTAPANELIRLMHGVGLKTRSVKDVLIVGGSRCSVYLADMLLKTGARVKIIEKDRARSYELAEHLPDATIICDDGSSQSVLLRENAGMMDSFVTLTNMDEENIIMSMYATHIGVPHVITKINRTEYNEILQHLSVNCIISPKLLCANDIIRYVRSMQNTAGRSVQTIHSLADDKAEALEFEVTENTRHLGVPFMDIPLKSQILFACIYRHGQVIIPNGSSCLKVGDNVVVVTTANRVILDLNDIFNDGE